MQNTQFVCQHISPYADYFHTLIVSCTYIHTHYVHIRAYPHTSYVYSYTYTYKHTHTHTHTFVLLPWLPFESTYFKICCPMSIKCKPVQIKVGMKAHMWWVCIADTVVTASSCCKGFTYSRGTPQRQSSESTWTPRVGTSWNRKQDSSLKCSCRRNLTLQLTLWPWNWTFKE